MFKDASKGLAPGSFGTLWGANLTGFGGSNAVLPANVAGTIPFPTKLADAMVVICGQLAPLYFSFTGSQKNSQINFLVPLVPTGPCTTVDEQLDGTGSYILATSNQVTLNVVPVAPTFFGDSTDVPPLPTYLQFWKAPAMFVGATVGATQKGVLTSPAGAGDILILYGTGLGATTPPVTPGNIPPTGVTAWVNAQTTATLQYQNGQQQTVTVLNGGSAASPQFAGLYQTAIQLPSPLLATGQATLLVTVGGIAADPITVYLK
jgi:uncharacterized protein (TIGR03437 family)